MFPQLLAWARRHGARYAPAGAARYEASGGGGGDGTAGGFGLDYLVLHTEDLVGDPAVPSITLPSITLHCIIK